MTIGTTMTMTMTMAMTMVTTMTMTMKITMTMATTMTMTIWMTFTQRRMAMKCRIDHKRANTCKLAGTGGAQCVEGAAPM